MTSGKFKCNKINSRYSVSKVRTKAEYDPAYFGFKGIKGDGSGVKICIIDTGYPKHKDIIFQSSRVVNFSESPKAALDVHGHSTGVSGILKAAGSNVRGLVPRADICYAKGIEDSGEGSHGSVQAALLYAIVKRADIVVMSFGSQIKHPILHDVVKKAYSEGIAMFAAAGQSKRSTLDSDYPARFPEVMSVGCASAAFPKAGNSDAPHIDLPIQSLHTTYLDDRYIKMSGTSIAAPVAAGVGAILLQQSRDHGRPLKPQQVYDKLLSLCQER